MNKTKAKKIASSGITVGQIKQMLKAAYYAKAVGNVRGIVNKGLSKGLAFNIFWKGYRKLKDDTPIKTVMEILGATHAIREFGEFWAGYVPKKPEKNELGKFEHQEAIYPYENE